jgi:hypothetical protein
MVRIDKSSSEVFVTGTRADASAAAPQDDSAFRARGIWQRLNAWYDPEWWLFVGILLAPALVFLVLGDRQRASFFFGAAVYLGALKWIGWTLITRRSEKAEAAALFFPAEILAGLALACCWFYLRNLAGWLWPLSYSLKELTVVTAVVIFLQAVGGVRRLARRGGNRPAYSWRGVGRSLALYLPFGFVLTAALWQVSAELNVPSSDPMYSAFMTRVYARDGMFFAHFAGGQAIPYPSGYAAMGAISLSLAPLSAVQSLYLQQVVLLVAALFLAAAVVACREPRVAWFIFLLPVAFLCFFPIYKLFPDTHYQGAPRQTAPALLAALCLLPALPVATQAWRFFLALGLEVMLGLVTLALNPACALFVALAGLIALVLRCRAAVRTGITRPMRILLFTGVAGLVLGLLVLGCDRYYSGFVTGPRPESSGPTAQATESQEPACSLARGLTQWREINPLALAPALSMTGRYPNLYLPLDDWHDRVPQQYFPAAIVLGAAVLVIHALSRRWSLAGSSAALAAIVAACCAGWFVLGYGVQFLMACLSTENYATDLLRVYTGFLLVRCQLLLLFLLLASTLGYLAVFCSQYLSIRPFRFAGIAVAIAGYLSLLGFVSYAVGQDWLTAPAHQLWGRVAADDLRLVRWIDDNIRPDQGLVGLTCDTFERGNDGVREKHIYPYGGAQAYPLYGRSYNFCFFALEPVLPPRPEPFDLYREHVADSFDPEWCLAAGIRYFYVSDDAIHLPDGRWGNDGLEPAIREGTLREIKRFGASALYEVVNQRAAR